MARRMKFTYVWLCGCDAVTRPSIKRAGILSVAGSLNYFGQQLFYSKICRCLRLPLNMLAS